MKNRIDIKLTFDNKGLEDFKLKDVNAIFNLYGLDQSYEFYKTKLIELIELIEPDYVNDVIENFSPEVFEYLKHINLLQTEHRLNLWSKFRDTLSDFYWRRVSLAKVILSISKLDPRISILLFYDLGLLNNIETDLDFGKAFEISTIKIPFIRRHAIDALLNSICNNDLPVGSRNNRKKFHEWLIGLKDYNLNNFLRYSDGELIATDSEFYELARVIYYRLPGYDFSLLTEDELQIIESFKKELNISGRFSRLTQFRDDEYEISEILEKITPDQLLLSTSIASLRPISEKSSRHTLINLYRSNKNLLEHPNLTEKQKKLLKFIVIPNEEGVYPTALHIAEELGISKFRIQYFINELLKLVRMDKVYYEHRGRVLKKNDSRLKILDLYENPKIRTQLSEDELSILDLFMERVGNQFIYSYEDIASILNLTVSMNTKVKTLVDKIQSLYES